MSEWLCLFYLRLPYIDTKKKGAVVTRGRKVLVKIGAH